MQYVHAITITTRTVSVTPCASDLMELLRLAPPPMPMRPCIMLLLLFMPMFALKPPTPPPMRPAGDPVV